MPRPTNPTNHALRLVRSGLFLVSSLGASALLAQTAAPPAGSIPADDDETVVLSPFTVSTSQDVGYRASNSIAGTRTNTAIRDIPLNIQVFTKDLYEDLLITNQVDLERYNASLVNGGADVHSDNPIQQAYNAFLFRGFVQNWGIRDGIREYDPVDTQGLARVEVVKGPAAPLYGLAYPGGIMNNITKEPDLQRDFGSLRLTAQSEGQYRGAVDANFSGELAGGRAGVRYNGAYTRSKDHRAHSEGQIQYNQVGLSWMPSPTTRLKFLAEEGRREKPNGLSYFTTGETDAAGNSLGNAAQIPLQILHPEIPWEWNWSNGQNMRSLDTKLYRGTIEQSLGDSFTVTGYMQYSSRQQIDGQGWDANGSGGADSWEAGGGWLDIGLPTERIELGYSYRDWSNDMHAYGATGIYKFDVAQTRNTFAFGANVWQEKFVSRSFIQSGSATPMRLVFPVSASIDTTAIPYAPPPDLQPQTTGNGFTRENNSNDYYFASWQMSALENRLKLNAAINRTNLKLVQWANGSSQVPDNTTEISKNSPMIGAMFDFTKEFSVFAVHSTSLFPETGKNSFGTQMPPVVGKSDEFGFKVELFNGKVSGTVSYYQINMTGGSQTDPTADNLNTQRWDAMTPEQRVVAFPGQTRSTLLGDLVPGAESESKGFEADVIFQPTRNWQLMLSYAHNDQEIVDAVNLATIGQSNPGHVKNQLSALTKYTFDDGPAKGLFVGLGLHRQGRALVDYQGAVARYNPKTFYAEVFGGYRFKWMRYQPVIQLNIKNLTKQEEFFGWKATGSSSVLATERYEVPTKMRYSLTLGLDF